VEVSLIEVPLKEVLSLLVEVFKVFVFELVKFRRSSRRVLHVVEDNLVEVGLVKILDVDLDVVETSRNYQT
jgi:hypothetical protein